MDARFFDAVTRSLATGTTRRRVVNAVVGAAGSGWLGFGARRLVAAGSACDDRACAGTCRDCGGVCVDIDYDPSNCGDCGAACKENEYCGGRGCLSTLCQLGQIDRGGGCTDLVSDPNNRGACGNACDSGRCEQRVCVPAGCPQGQTDCGGSCVSPATDPANCGGCGVACASGECRDGGCVPVSPPPTEEPATADPPTPEAAACPDGSTRRGDKCVATCADGQVLDGDSCRCTTEATSSAALATAAAPAGAAAVSLRITRALVDAPIEPLDIQNGSMQSPTGTWAAGWYRETGRLGVPGNVVLTGYPDWWGAAVFWFVNELQAGNTIDLTGDDGNLYHYDVNDIQTYDKQTAPLQPIVDPGLPGELVTLFVGAPPFDQAGGYQSILVVRASRRPGASSPAPASQLAVLTRPAGCPVPPDSLRLPGVDVATAQATSTDPVENGRQQIAERDALDIPRATLADAATVGALDALIKTATPRGIVVRQAPRLPDGRALALVRPAGDLPVDAVTGVVPAVGRDVAKLVNAKLCAFMLFTRQSGGWHVAHVYAA